ncbi:MAG: glycosyltransferase [Frankiales bacterium]|nr:glycosyltransferase [Frankiales bacterium]
MTLTSPQSDSRAESFADSPTLSVVVPTRNEADNVDQLVSRTAAALDASPWSWELLLVDDSDDDTPDRARALGRAGAPVRVMHRRPGSRVDGLSGAVSSGFGAARGQLIAVMDADLQHPPEVLPELVSAVVAGADVAVGSRYCEGAAPDATDGLDGSWRRWVSRLCRVPVWLVRPRLRSVRDPLAGFFVVRRSVLSGVVLRPTGYKILLEVLVRGRWDRTVEVPYRFAPRVAGTSKAELRQGLVFLRHVLRLAGPGPSRS